MGKTTDPLEKMAMNWEGKNVLVTGANGFIGSWITNALISKKANVITIMRDVRKYGNLDLFSISKKVSMVHGDITRYKDIERAFNEYDVDTCFHLAAQSLVGIANRSPLSTFNSNIKGTWNVLEACRTSETIERVIVASSDKAYGTHKKLPYTEDFALLGEYPYPASKVCTDVIARCYFFTYGLPVAVTRCSNIYGGGDMNFSRLIPDAIRHVIKGKKFVLRSRGTSERDYMYVKDGVSAYLTLAENVNRADVKGGAFNFGTGTPISATSLFSKICSIAGKTHLKPIISGKARNEIDRQYVDSSKAKKLLGWTAAYTIDTGLAETVRWYKDFLMNNGGRL
jgi:CDP-glucose 4,6-dehydratase